MAGLTVTIDIEPTNRCNADCYFCPRDQTPHQGLMSPEVFEQTLARTVQFTTLVRERADGTTNVSLCGLGEALLNKHTPDFISQIRAAGLRCSMSSNGALLDERRSTAVLDAGLQHIDINVGETGDEYEKIYKLPWDKTLRNILRFRDMAQGRCEVQIILVDHREDADHLERMREFWRGHGIDLFHSYQLINRGGSLTIDAVELPATDDVNQAGEMLRRDGGVPVCLAPFVSIIVGYDGIYYLCCSDWKKQYPLGSVFDRSIDEILGEKFRHTATRSAICQTCSFDPSIRLSRTLEQDRSSDRTPTAPLVAGMLRREARALNESLERIAPGVTSLEEHEPQRRRLIPVTVV